MAKRPAKNAPKRAPRRTAKKNEPIAANELAVEIATAIRRKVGYAESVLLGSDPLLSEVKEWVPTGLHWFDQVLSDGAGLPVGKALELYGAFSTGKSALGQYLIGQYQHRGGLGVLIDFENTMDSAQLECYGIDRSKLLPISVDTAEEAWDGLWEVYEKLLKHQPDYPALIVWDSVAQSLTEAEHGEKKTSQSHPGALARVFSKSCRKLARRIGKVRATVLFINQVRSNIGVMFGSREARPAGKALDYVCNYLIRAYRISSVKKGDETTGYVLGMKTERNRLHPPHRTAEVCLSFETGLDRGLSMLHFLKKHGLITAAGKAGMKLKGQKTTFTTVDWPNLYARSSFKERVARVIRKWEEAANKRSA